LLGRRASIYQENGGRVRVVIHNVYVFDVNGLPVISVKLGSIEADSALLTGFLSAMESFSRKIAQGDVEEINIKDYRFHIKACGSLYVALAADKTDKDTAYRLSEICKVVEKQHCNFEDKIIELEIKNIATRKIGLMDRATDWAHIGL
jgi:predicted regulator of Ras-like GTPase activity (Roadblock/LC7/MglB family)